MDFDKIVIVVFVLPMIGIMFLLMFVWAPVHLWNEHKCLEAGYPSTNTSIFLDGYCMNLEGDIAVKVEKL